MIGKCGLKMSSEWRYVNYWKTVTVNNDMLQRVGFSFPSSNASSLNLFTESELHNRAIAGLHFAPSQSMQLGWARFNLPLDCISLLETMSLPCRRVRNRVKLTISTHFPSKLGAFCSRNFHSPLTSPWERQSRRCRRLECTFDCHGWFHWRSAQCTALTWSGTDSSRIPKSQPPEMLLTRTGNKLVTRNIPSLIFESTRFYICEFLVFCPSLLTTACDGTATSPKCSTSLHFAIERRAFSDVLAITLCFVLSNIRI